MAQIIKILERLTFYDILAILVPGCLIECVFVYFHSCQGLLYDIPEPLIWIGFVVIGYFLGLINNAVLEILWIPLRNNGYLNEKTSKETKRCNLIIVGIAIVVISCVIAYYYWSCFWFYIALTPLIIWIVCLLKHNNDVKAKYIKDYYILESKDKNDRCHALDRVHTIEMQTDFMRNMIGVLVVAKFFICNQYVADRIFCLLPVLFIACLWRQIKIFRIIKEEKDYND